MVRAWGNMLFQQRAAKSDMGYFLGILRAFLFRVDIRIFVYAKLTRKES